jgi:DNA-binding response OmpR family regulator
LRFLIVSQDERLLRALAQHSPESRFQQVDGVAGALRALEEHDYDGAALDGGLPHAMLDEFTRWWDSLGLRAPLVVMEPAAERAERGPVARRAVDILDALRARRAFRLLVGERVLEWAGVRVRLTRSEARVLSTLVEAGVPLSASALQEKALGYAGDGSAVRTHVSTLRRKCSEAGLEEPIVTRDRRYRAPRVRLVPQVG